MKTIAMERGLDVLKTMLEQRGYKVVFTDEITENVTAYVYEGSNALMENSFQALDNSFTYSGADNASILLVNSKDKTPDDIVAMIENRLYSPLF